MKEMGFMGDGNFAKPKRTWSNPELVTRQAAMPPLAGEAKRRGIPE